MKQDPYRFQQAEQRKAAHVQRQTELREVRDKEWGSPIHGVPTPFVESFDSGGQAPMSTPPTDEEGNALAEAYSLPTSPHVRNYLLSGNEVEKTLEQSYLLTKPFTSENGADLDPDQEEDMRRKHEERHRKAVIALQRITNLENGGALDLKHANIRRCVEVFGRHNTDHTLERPAPPRAPDITYVTKPPRAGPDTGSSEVQIAILTAKIRALALRVEAPKGHRDKHKKRHLRLLCHRRQRLLRYMEKKERGSGRWHHMIEKLGLSPATWKKQISF